MKKVFLLISLVVAVSVFALAQGRQGSTGQGMGAGSQMGQGQGMGQGGQMGQGQGTGQMSGQQMGDRGQMGQGASGQMSQNRHGNPGTRHNRKSSHSQKKNNQRGGTARGQHGNARHR